MHVVTLSRHIDYLCGSIATVASIGVSVVVVRLLLDLFLLQHIGDQKPPLTILRWILRHLILLLGTPVRDEITREYVARLLSGHPYFLIVLIHPARTRMPELRMKFVFALRALQIDNLSN